MPNNTTIERNDSSPSKLDEVSSPEPIMPMPPPFPGVLNEKPAKSLMSISASGKLVVDRIDLPLPTPEEEVRKIMANATSWNWISSVSQSLAIYTQVRPTIQRGPQCGLVALSMASQVYPTTVTVDDLLNVAKERKYTNHGEMFSADNLCSLTNDMLDGVQAVVKTKLLSEPAEFIRHLLEGDLILLPYDSDHSHMPGNYGGRKAHWALVCGCIIQSNDLNYLPGKQSLKPDIQMDKLWHYRPKNVGIDVLNRPQSVPILTDNCSAHLNHRSARSVTPNLTPTFDLFGNEWRHKISSLIVLWRQGKSRHLIASPLEELRLSNGQLFEYPDSGNYIIDSVSEGLGGKLIVMHKMKQGLSDLLGVLQGSKSEQ